MQVQPAERLLLPNKRRFKWPGSRSRQLSTAVDGGGTEPHSGVPSTSPGTRPSSVDVTVGRGSATSPSLGHSAGPTLPPAPLASTTASARSGIRCRICSCVVPGDGESMERHLRDCLGTLRMRQRTSTDDHELRRTLGLTKDYISVAQRVLSTSSERFASLCDLVHQVQQVLLRGIVVDVDADTAEGDLLSILHQMEALVKRIEHAEATALHESGTLGQWPSLAPAEPGVIDHVPSRRHNRQGINLARTAPVQPLASPWPDPSSSLHFPVVALHKSANVVWSKLQTCRRIGHRHPVLAGQDAARAIVGDLQFLEPLGMGGAARVFLGCRRGMENELVAIKVMSKRFLKQMKLERYAWQELEVLRMFSSAVPPFVVQLHSACSLNDYLFLVMEYLPGGLENVLETQRVLTRHEAHFYLAELVRILGFYHDQGVVHRDLKPANLMLGKDGHIKMIDFGLCRFDAFDKKPSKPTNAGASSMHSVHSRGRTSTRAESCSASAMSELEATSEFTFVPVELEGKLYSPVGTTHYCAPEVVLGCGHDHTVDWWSVGVLAFQMFTGVLPFVGDTPEAIQDNILNLNIQWPPSETLAVDADAVEFILALLCAEPAKRLGARGAAEVKAHHFFEGTAWDRLFDSPAPNIPRPRERSPHAICDVSETCAFTSPIGRSTGDDQFSTFFYDSAGGQGQDAQPLAR